MNPAYKKAFDAYDRCIETIRLFAETANKVIKERNPHGGCDVETVLYDFDAILQYSLMQVAVNDYEFSIQEARFLRDLAQYCDFCDYVSGFTDAEVDWDLFLNCKVSLVKKLLEVEDIYEDVRGKAENLAILFAMIDAATPDTDFYESFRKDFGNILYAMMLADGEAEKDEIEGCFFIEFLAMISAKKDEKEEKYYHNNAKTSSLKDFYLKKKR